MTKQWNINDTVYIEQSYPDDPSRPFVARTITATYSDETWLGGYILDNPVLAYGSETYIRSPPESVEVQEPYYEDLYYIPAMAGDFLQMGDSNSRGVIVSPDTIYDDLSN